MLTLTLKMAARTDDTKWTSRFEELGHRTSPVVEQNWHISQESTIHADAFLMDFANNQLMTTESNALELICRGDRENAAILLQSQEYQEQKDEYNREMNAFFDGVRKTLQERYDRCRNNIQNALIAIGIILPAIALIWLGANKTKNHLYRHSKKRHKGEYLNREWQETFNAITDGVCIIDKDGKTIVQCNKAMTRFLKSIFMIPLSHRKRLWTGTNSIR